MPAIDLFNLEATKVGQIELDDAVFGVEVKPHLYHEVVKYQLAARRQGTHKAKTRGEIAGSTSKPFRQKGTGRARQGTKKAPNMRSGGVVFGPSPRDYTPNIPKRVRKVALKSALTSRVNDQKLIVVDDLTPAAISTKKYAGIMKSFSIDKALIVDGDNTSLALSVRNHPSYKYLHVDGLNLYDVLRYDTLVLSKAAVEVIEKRLSK